MRLARRESKRSGPCGIGFFIYARNHALIRAQLAALLRQYPRVVVLGGSHDSTHSTVCGLFDASGGQSVGGLNFDAHADIRNKPVVSSGTPFGKLLREGFLAGPRFTEIGLLYDRDNQTARLVVTIVTAFITGVAASLTQAR